MLTPPLDYTAMSPKPRRHALGYSLLMLIVIMAIVLWTAPAALLPFVFQRWVPSVQLEGVSGSLWRGQAANIVVNLKQQPLALGYTQWQLEPLSLLTLTPRLHLSTNAQHYRSAGTFSLSFHHWSVDELEAQFPLTLLEPWLPQVVSGTAQLELKQLQVTGDTVQAIDASVTLDQLQWVGGDRLMPLGDYTITLSTEDDTIYVTFQDQQARLAINGWLTLQADGQYQLHAQLQGTNDLAPEIDNALHFLGKQQADGSVLVQRQGVRSVW